MLCDQLQSLLFVQVYHYRRLEEELGIRPDLCMQCPAIIVFVQDYVVEHEIEILKSERKEPKLLFKIVFTVEDFESSTMCFLTISSDSF